MLRRVLFHYQQGTLLEAVQRKGGQWARRLGMKRPPIGDVYYGRRAGAYVKERVITPLYQAEQGAVEKLLQEVPDGASVLDVPFGTGRFVPLYARKAMQVSGLDASADMIAAAKEELGEKFQPCKVEVGDAARLPYANESFHLLVCVRFLGVIVPFGQAKQALREFGRVTQERAIISFNERRDGTLRWRGPRDNETMGGRLYGHEIEALLRDAGFRVVRKVGPLSETARRVIYMYLCEKTKM